MDFYHIIDTPRSTDHFLKGKAYNTSYYRTINKYDKCTVCSLDMDAFAIKCGSGLGKKKKNHDTPDIKKKNTLGKFYLSTIRFCTISLPR